MAKSDAVLKLIQEEEKSSKELKQSIDEFTSVLVDQNEELIATFVEGTKRLINKEGKDVTPELKKIESTTKSSLESVRKGVADVERAIKGIKPASSNNLLLEARTTKNEVKKIREKVSNFEVKLPKEAKDALPVRLSDGEKFYNAIESIASFPTTHGGGGGGGAPEYNEGQKISTIRGHAWLAEGPSDILTAPRTDSRGHLVNSPHVEPNNVISERVTNTDGASTALSSFGATTGQYNMITMITAYNSSGTAGYVDIRNGTTGAVFFTVPLPAGGGAVCPFVIPLRQPSSGTALAYDVSGALSTVYLSFVGFKSEI